MLNVTKKRETMCVILTDVLWSAACASVLLPRMKSVGQAKVDEFDVGLWRLFV